MPNWSGWSREEKERYLLLRQEKERRAREAARERIRAFQAKGELTPEVVADFAYLHFINDQTGEPIRPAAHHWLWLRLICNQHIKKLWIIATPESAKTTWLLAYTACSIGFWPEYPRLIAATTGDVAEKRSIALRTLVQSPEFQRTFPGISRAVGMKWDSAEWSVAPDGKPHRGRLHPTVFSVGTGGSIIGTRAREAIGDDLLDFENTRTQHQRDTVNNWLHTSFISRVVAQVGTIRMIGNAWHHDDAAARARKAGDWVICHTPILSEGPEVFANIWYPEDYQGERLGEPVGAEVEMSE
jgi:hypothetical protein